jgi:YD repeat-containing protein
VRLAEIALSCSDPVRMPTSLVLAVPKGPLVLVVRPPVPDLKLIATMLAFKLAGAILKAIAKALGKLIRFLQRGPLSKFFEKLSKKMKSKNPKGSRARQMWNDFVCFLTGHPVDVATGRVITSQTDLELFGPLPLTFSRRYDSSASHRPGVLGYGWAHPFDQAVWPERGAVVLRAEDGREIEFSTLDFPDHAIAPGREVFLPHEGLTLRVHGDHHFTVTDKQGTVREFARIPSSRSPYGPPSGGASDLIGLRDRETRLVSVTNRLGQRQLFHYDQLGQLESVTDPAGRRLQFQYDRQGRLLRADITGTDGITHIVGIYRYDSAGDLVEAMDALGHAYRYEYVEHLLVKETNKNGLSFYFQYDGVDSTAKCVRTWGDGGIYDHLITYDPANQRTLVENSLGHITLYQLNDLGQVVSILDANGGETKYEYEHPSGQKTKEVDPNGAETKSEYDERGNLTKVIDAEGAEITFEYNPRDQLTRAVDPIGGQWRWGYDENGRLVGRANPLEERTQFYWDGPLLVAVTDPLGQHTRLGYDAAQNLVSLTAPDQSVTYWSYDGLGRTHTTTDPNGNSRRLERDLLGRVVQVSEPDGNQRSLAYDPEGNVTRAQDRQYDVTFEYRGMNRLAARTQAGTRVEFHYDTEDQLTAIKNEHGFVYRFVLGPTGNVDEEWGFDDLRRRYVRDPAGRVIEVVRPEGKTTQYTYDKVGRVTAVEHSDGTAEAYAYRPDGALIKAENSAASLEFERDPLGRITKELIGNDWVSSEYDPLGLRKTVRSSKGLFQKIRRNGMGDVLAIDAEVGNTSTSAPANGNGNGIICAARGRRVRSGGRGSTRMRRRGSTAIGTGIWTLRPANF